MTRKLLLLIPVAALLLVGVAAAQDEPVQAGISCDADLMMNLYVAERFFDYDEFRSRLAGSGVQFVDPNQLNFGQFEPLFAELENMDVSSGIFADDDFNAITETLTMDDAAFEQTLRDRFGADATTMLNPAAVEGEANECAQLRSNLNRFFSALAIHDFSTGFMLGEGLAQPGAEATPAGEQTGDEAQATPAGEETGAEAPPAVTAPDATLDDVLDNPDAFYGQVVSVEGLLREFVNERTFWFNDQDPILPDELLVISPEEGMFDASIEEGVRVRVTGEVRQFVLADIETELDFDLDDNLFVDVEGRPVIIASEMVVVETQP